MEERLQYSSKVLAVMDQGTLLLGAEYSLSTHRAFHLKYLLLVILR